MMQSNEYVDYDSYDYVVDGPNGMMEPIDDESGMMLVSGGTARHSTRILDINFDDPKIASMPKILLMGPRRGGKSSIQVCKLGALPPNVHVSKSPSSSSLFSEAGKGVREVVRSHSHTIFLFLFCNQSVSSFKRCHLMKHYSV